jgi:hypothetical protein
VYLFFGSVEAEIIKPSLLVFPGVGVSRVSLVSILLCDWFLILSVVHWKLFTQ